MFPDETRVKALRLALHHCAESEPDFWERVCEQERKDTHELSVRWASTAEWN